MNKIFYLAIPLLFVSAYYIYNSQTTTKEIQALEVECSQITGQTIEIGTFHYEMVEKTLTDQVGVYNPDHTYVNGSTVLSSNSRLPNFTADQKAYFPKTEVEASLLIQCASQLGKQISVRGGGHEYNGATLQGDIVISTRDIVLDTGKDLEIIDDNQLRVNSNYRFGNLYKHLYEMNPQFNIVAGSCPTVVIGGFTLGGGHGTMSGYYGIATHYLKEARVITPTGEIKDVNDETDPEYIKNIRGAGHNLGLILSLTFDYSTIPQENWNFAIYEGRVNPQQFTETIKAFEKASKENQFQFQSIAYFGAGVSDTATVRLYAYAPISQMSLQDIKSSTQQYFQHVSLVPGGELENKPYYEVVTYNIPGMGSIAVQWGWAALVQGMKYENYNVYNSYKASGALSNIEQSINQINLGWLAWTGVTNYRYKQTGPFVNKSVYHTYADSSDSDVVFLIQIAGADKTAALSPQSIFENLDYKYINYSPNFGSLTEDTFFKQNADEVREFRQNIDPTQKFTNKFDVLKIDV